ncbi:MAG: DnaJ domain-containing protein, partial [Desulfobacterales bacterium]|nr:DnaJ domain-containing protein [Desulfobacterales bacterium]
MKDFYKILGVEEEASEEEIRARWIELTKHYHPDLGKTEEGDEKIKEINEAYEILKNESTRFHYDFERDLKRSFIKKAHRRQERRMNIRKIIIVPSGILILFLIVGFILFRRGEVSPPLRTEAKTEALHKIDRGSEKKTASQIPPVKKDSKAQQESEAPKEIKKEVVPPESKKTVLLSPPRSSSAVERESEQKKEPPRKILPESKVPVKVEKEVPKAVREGIPQERRRIASAPVLPPAKKESEARGKTAPQVVMKSEIPALKEVSKEVPKELPKEAPKEVLKEVPKEVSKEVPKEVPKHIAKEAPKELPKEAPKEVLKEVPKEVSKEVPKEIPKQVAKEGPKELPKEAPKEMIRVTLHPGEKLTIGTKEEKTGAFSRSLLAKEEEVEQFFSNYVDRYNRKDVGGFLSFFSSKAIQNQTDGLEAIGNLYTKFINQSEELQYQI